jgi:hypothetical protein
MATDESASCRAFKRGEAWRQNHVYKMMKCNLWRRSSATSLHHFVLIILYSSFCQKNRSLSKAEYITCSCLSTKPKSPSLKTKSCLQNDEMQLSAIARRRPVFIILYSSFCQKNRSLSKAEHITCSCLSIKPKSPSPKTKSCLQNDKMQLSAIARQRPVFIILYSSFCLPRDTRYLVKTDLSPR